jgi:hypothetical protein
VDLFEILFIAFFILIPVLEGIMKKRRKQSGAPPRADTDDARGPAEEPASAADMVPDDLWQVLTGERRDRGRSEPVEPTGTPWSSEPERAETAESVTESVAVETGDWRSEPWVVDEEAEIPEPVSLEYRGPEAYSLEEAAPPPESLERPLPSARARHDAFHERLDRDQRARRTRPRPRSSALIRALRRPDGLRQAVLMKEILGPPRGLE